MAAGVLALHVALIWAFGKGLQTRVSQVLVPVALLTQWLPAPQSPAAHPTSTPAPLLAAAQQPSKAAALHDPTTTPQVPSGADASLLFTATATDTDTAMNTAMNTALNTSKATAKPAPEAAAAPLATARPAATRPDAPAALQLPSSSAAYLHNPKPPYPPLSARLGETGRTVHKVWVGVDGKPQRAELVSSSGFSRLDRAAHDAVMGWRYVPGTRGGVAELMAFNVPIQWELLN